MPSTLVWNLALTAAAAVGLALLCRLPVLQRRPALRQWLWLLLIVKMVTPPLISLPLLPAEPSVTSSPIADSEVVPAQPAETLLVADIPEWPDTEGKRKSESEWGESECGDADVAGGTASVGASSAAPLSYATVLAAISILGTGVLLTFGAFRAVRLHRWIRRAGTENPLLSELCAELAARMGIRGGVEGRVVDARTTPFLWGLRRHSVVLPRRLVDELSRDRLRGIVAHELGHLVRRDHWVNLFVFFVKAAMWWNPVIWWAERELAAAQELCCDAIAVDLSGTDRRGYAATLLEAIEFIQDEPFVSYAPAPGMGSKRSILRRFEMIGETRLSHRLSRRAMFLLLVFVLPLLCIPVRAEEEKAEEKPAAAATENKGKSETSDEAKRKPTGADAIDPEILKLGKAVRKRITTYTDEQTLVISDGKTGRMKVKKNATPVAEILITPHFEKDGTKFDLEGADADGKIIEGTKTTSPLILSGNVMRLNMALGKHAMVEGKYLFCKIQLAPTRSGNTKVSVEVKVLFAPLPTPEETKAMLLAQGKKGRVQVDFQEIGLQLMLYESQNGDYPKDLKELKKPLPKDLYSPGGEDYHYKRRKDGFILGSCGEDGIYGNDDDEMLITKSPKGTQGSDGKTFTRSVSSMTGQRHELDLTEDDKAPAATGKSAGKAGMQIKPKERVLGKRPRGNCSISGKVVSAETGEPIEGGRMYLHYNVTHGSIFVNTAADGTFAFVDIPEGPFSLTLSLSPGYQDVGYNPDGKPENVMFPPFSLKKGENRSGIVLKAKRAYQISGKVRDEKGNIPKDMKTLTVLGWFHPEGSLAYTNVQARVNPKNGSYTLDGLNGKPVYVMAIDWQAARKGTARPPIYYPGTFSRNEAKPVVFGEKHQAQGVDITLRNEGGLVLEGTVADKEGKLVPEAFVVAHRADMLFDFVTAYTDEKGRYRIDGLGEGAFLVHVDAVHRGFVRTRTPVDIKRKSETTEQDFTLNRGVEIVGKLVDEEGKDWEIGQSYGHAHVMTGDDSDQASGSFSLTNFRNKHRVKGTGRGSGGSFSLGEGDYRSNQMLFPTKSTFVIQGVKPGQTRITFLPKKEGCKVLKILVDGKDVQESGIETKPGEEVKDVQIVIGKPPVAAKENEKESKPNSEKERKPKSEKKSEKKSDSGGEQAGDSEIPKSPAEWVHGERPRGNCSISGKVVAAETGEPIEGGTMYLFYTVNYAAIYVRTAADGTFAFDDIPKGPFTLRFPHHNGYQNAPYDPDGERTQIAQFTLGEGEHRSGIVLKAKPACAVAGKVLDENGNVPENAETLKVLAWFKKDDWKVYCSTEATVNPADGSYLLDGLDGEPVYVMAMDRRGAREEGDYPPSYYPGTFSRKDASLVTFDEKRRVDGIDITLKKEGGLVLEGVVVDAAGKPVPEALVVACRPDMLGDFVTAYTDEEGRYRIHGLGEGAFVVYADAAHRGLIIARTTVDLDGNNKRREQNFTLNRGVEISGKLVDEEGADWEISEIGSSFGQAHIGPGDEPGHIVSGPCNKYSPRSVEPDSEGDFMLGEGDCSASSMAFPTKSTFVIRGMKPGHALFYFSPKREGQKVVKILLDGKDITKSGIETKAGEEIEGVEIVIGKSDGE